MAEILQAIFIDPPIAIARLGSSSVPQDAFVWTDGLNPRGGDDTALLPQWTLDVQPDGSVIPRMPTSLAFRDGSRIRPVCPYFEIWGLFGEPQSDDTTWKAVPLTPKLLQDHGAATSNLLVRFNAINAKAGRRRNSSNLRFGTFPPQELRGNQLTGVAVLGVSPPGVVSPMIPVGRNIPLGRLQFIRSTAQPAPGATLWADTVNVEILRFRFTPPPGRFYGPPAAAVARPSQDGRPFASVPQTRAFLNPAAGWFGVSTVGIDQPADTYDAVDADQTTGPSLGVVDDTSDARISVELTLPTGQVLKAEATLFVGPPDFAPDRRPFLSLADEVNDRAATAQTRSSALTAEQLDQWVEDLFERAFEVVSLMNVDQQRQDRGIRQLSPAELTTPLPNDGLPDNRAMGARDRLRNRTTTIAPFVPGVDPLPLTAHARSRHRTLADLVELKRFVRTNQGRLKALVRPSFVVGPGETARVTSMQMPPFMRNSNAQPLTLAAWQYDLLMKWANDIEQTPSPAAIAPRPTTPAERRMEEVLRRVATGPAP